MQGGAQSAPVERRIVDDGIGNGAAGDIFHVEEGEAIFAVTADEDAGQNHARAAEFVLLGRLREQPRIGGRAAGRFAHETSARAGVQRDVCAGIAMQIVNFLARPRDGRQGRLCLAPGRTLHIQSFI